MSIDALKAVANNYEFINTIESITSVGSSSPEWIANTFTQSHINKIRDTALLTVNGYAHEILVERKSPTEAKGISFAPINWDTVSSHDFSHYEEVWRFLPENPRQRYDPGAVTDRAVAVHRDKVPERMIVHYNQPHAPYLHRKFEDPDVSLNPWEESPFEYLRDGGEFSKVWDAYLAELRYVLDEVELLLENVDAETVIISADHGEAFGELGLLYGHPPGIPHPVLREVPWVQTSATNKNTYDPQIEPTTTIDPDIEEHLRFLGYRD